MAYDRSHRGGGGRPPKNNSRPPQFERSFSLKEPTITTTADCYLINVIAVASIGTRAEKGRIIEFSIDNGAWEPTATDDSGKAAHNFLLVKATLKRGETTIVRARCLDNPSEEQRQPISISKLPRPHEINVEVCGKNGKYFLLLQATDEAKEGVLAKIIIASTDGQPILRKNGAINTDKNGYAKVDLLPFCKADEQRTVLLKVIGSTIVKTINLGEAKKEGNGPDYSSSPIRNFFRGLSGG